MLDIICLWIGRVVFGILSAIIIIIGLYIFYKMVSILFRRPWYCIKRLMPWKWITIEDYKLYKKKCFQYKKEPDKYENWRKDMKIFRKGRFGKLFIPNKPHWWQPKNYFFFIKNNKK